MLKTGRLSNWHSSCVEGSTNLPREFHRMSAQENYVALPLRAHTILGACEGIGEDFGFNPVLLRIPFAASVLISPTMAIGSYLLLGLVVLSSRKLFPKAKQGQVKDTAAHAIEPANEQRELAKVA